MPIRTEKQLDAATAVLHELVDRKRDAGEVAYLDVLSDLITKYEDEHDPIEDVAPGAMLAFLMEQHSPTQKELEQKTAIAQSTISAILTGSHQMTVEPMKLLAAAFKVASATSL